MLTWLFPTVWKQGCGRVCLVPLRQTLPPPGSGPHGLLMVQLPVAHHQPLCQHHCQHQHHRQRQRQHQLHLQSQRHCCHLSPTPGQADHLTQSDCKRSRSYCQLCWGLVRKYMIISIHYTGLEWFAVQSKTRNGKILTGSTSKVKTTFLSFFYSKAGKTPSTPFEPPSPSLSRRFSNMYDWISNELLKRVRFSKLPRSCLSIIKFQLREIWFLMRGEAFAMMLQF